MFVLKTTLICLRTIFEHITYITLLMIFNYIPMLFRQLSFVDLTKMRKVSQIISSCFRFHSSVLDPELRSCHSENIVQIVHIQNHGIEIKCHFRRSFQIY